MTTAPALETDRRCLVYVVTFSPADDQGGFGGYVWDRSLAAMEAVYEDEFRHSASDSNPRLVRLVPITVGGGEVHQITDELEGRTDEFESEAPALRQFVPCNTISAHVPTGGLVRRDPHRAARTAPIDYTVTAEMVGVVMRGRFPNLAGLLDNVKHVGNWESLEERVATVAEHRERHAGDAAALLEFEAACANCDDLPSSPLSDDLLVWWDLENESLIGDPATLAAELVNAREPQFDALFLTIGEVNYLF